MNGLELQRRLAQNGNPVPVIFLSARASEEDERSALRAGAVQFLRKTNQQRGIAKRHPRSPWKAIITLGRGLRRTQALFF